MLKSIIASIGTVAGTMVIIAGSIEPTYSMPMSCVAFVEVELIQTKMMAMKL